MCHHIVYMLICVCGVLRKSVFCDYKNFFNSWKSVSYKFLAIFIIVEMNILPQFGVIIGQKEIFHMYFNKDAFQNFLHSVVVGVEELHPTCPLVYIIAPICPSLKKLTLFLPLIKKISTFLPLSKKRCSFWEGGGGLLKKVACVIKIDQIMS